MTSVPGGVRHTVMLFDVDPDLAAGLSPREEEAARLQAQAGVLEIRTPRWDPSPFREAATDGWLGLLLFSGLMIRRVTVGERASCELLGPGDVIRPWDTDGDHEPLPTTIDWLVIRSVRLAVLDESFQRRIARWPSITGRLVSRIAGRARSLALTQAVTHLPRVHARVLILFWLLAERWGKVSPDGVRVTLPVTHDVVAMLVGARRPTVTISLQRLAHDGLMYRESSDRWLLTNAAIELVGTPATLARIDHASHGNGALAAH
jgi:CRP-like cAMP-binding protein